MSQKDEYGRGMWMYYDLVFAGSADVEFYVEEAKRARGPVLELGERTLIVWETCEFDLVAQTVTCSRIFEEFDSHGQSTRRTCAEIRLRYIHRYEMRYLAELCGYRIIGLYGDFGRGPFRHGGEQIWELEWRTA